MEEAFSDSRYGSFEGYATYPKKPSFYHSPQDRWEDKIKQLPLLHPSKGCKYLEHLLALQGTRVSSVTIHKHLDQAGLGKKYDPWLALEQLGAQSPQKQANKLRC